MRIKSILFTVLAMFGFSGCGEEYTKVPFSVPVDFSKKGTVYETNFKTTFNPFGSEVGFYVYSSHVSQKKKYSERTEDEKAINYYLRTGVLYDENNRVIPTEETPYFKLKVTLTPLGWASNNITIRIADYSKAGYGKNAIWQEKEYKNGEKIEFITTLQLYSNSSDKTFMIADLQRLRNYHIRVESLEDIELPDGVYIGFAIEEYSRKV